MNRRPAQARREQERTRQARTRHAWRAGWVIAILCAGGWPARAEGDREYGAYLASQCVTCHQATGQSAGGVPAIIGWAPDQFAAVMMAYRHKERDNEVMRTVAAALSDEEIAALATYFGDLKAAGGP